MTPTERAVLMFCCASIVLHSIAIVILNGRVG